MVLRAQITQLRKTQADKPLWSLMKSDSQMQAELIKPDRCRLELIPLVDSNPVMKARRHQSLWQLYLSPEGGCWGLCMLLICHCCNTWVQTGLIWMPSMCSPLCFPPNGGWLILQHTQWKCQSASYTSLTHLIRWHQPSWLRGRRGCC